MLSLFAAPTPRAPRLQPSSREKVARASCTAACPPHSKLGCLFECWPDLKHLPDDIQMTVLLSIQEVSSNTWVHVGSRNVKVSLPYYNSLILEISWGSSGLNR